MPVVELRGISKRYKIYPSGRDRLKEALSFGRVRRGHDFWALRDINLDVEQGTAVGILGRNGAGKSTLLKIISGVLKPTSGTKAVNGRLAALLQLGAGFNSEFTGRENVLMNGLILGIDRKEMLERFDEIEAFADIGEFMDQPVKTYSSGMRARLGFAVSVNVEPDILVVDETLSVGDAVFKHMGLQKMRELRDSGTTILFVSHSLGMVKNFCGEAVLLHKGDLLAHGGTSETIDRYQALLSSTQVKQSAGVLSPDAPLNYDIDEEGEAPDFKEDPALARRGVSSLRHGTGEARITNVELLDETGAPTDTTALGSTLTARVHLEYAEAVEGSILGITVRNKAGLDVFSTDTNLEKAKIGSRAKGERLVVDFTFEVPLKQGAYSINAAVSYPQSKKLYMDWLDVAAVFKVRRPEGRGAIPGLVYIPTRVEVHSPYGGRRNQTA